MKEKVAQINNRIKQFNYTCDNIVCHLKPYCYSKCMFGNIFMSELEFISKTSSYPLIMRETLIGTPHHIQPEIFWIL